nr:hypothetical protein ISGA_2280 [Gordonia sp. NB41Y]
MRRATRVRDVLAEHAAEHDRDGSIPVEGLAALWDEGLGVLGLAPEYGGLGADLPTTVRVVREIAAGDPSAALIYNMTIVQHWTLSDPRFEFPERLRDEILAESDRPVLLNLFRGEHDLGTPLYGGFPATTARYVAEEDGQYTWRLQGTKAWGTGSAGLRWMAVWAVTTDDPEGPRVGNFFVRTDSPGIEILDEWDSLGMRATASHDVKFDDVEVPAHRVHGLVSLSEASSVSWPADFGARISLLFLALYSGVAAASLQWFVDYIKVRTPPSLGKPLATLPRFQESVGESRVHLVLAQRRIDQLAEDVDSGGERGAAASQEAWLHKTELNENLIRVAEIPIAILGNPGLSRKNDLQRHYRNLLSSRAHGPDRVQSLTLLGSELIGEL